MNKTKNIAIFASGQGSNAQSIIDFSKKGECSYRVSIIITNNPKAGVIDIAKKEQIPHIIIDGSFNIVEALKKLKVKLIALAGFLWKVPDKIIDNFFTLNVHPSLLPKYGGKGMYGINVHKAVIENGETYSGMTVHQVTKNYDEGPILYKKDCLVYLTDNPHELQERVKKLEHEYYPSVIDECCRLLVGTRIMR